MNNSIQAINKTMTTGELQPALIDEFIAYIDRGEQTTRTYITFKTILKKVSI